MNIDLKTEGNGYVLVLQGRLDASSASNVKDRLKALSEPGREIVIDMDQVVFMDSSGLGALVASLRGLREIKGDIKLARLTSNVRHVFELTRAFRLFDIFDSRTAALESLKSETAK